MSLRRFPASEDEKRLRLCLMMKTPIEELEAPALTRAERNLVTILTTDLDEVGVGLATHGCSAWLRPTALKVIDKFREPPPDSQGSSPPGLSVHRQQHSTAQYSSLVSLWGLDSAACGC